MNNKQQIEKKAFDPVDFLETYLGSDEGDCESWDTPYSGPIEENNDEPPPKIARYTVEDFDYINENYYGEA